MLDVTGVRFHDMFLIIIFDVSCHTKRHVLKSIRIVGLAWDDNTSFSQIGGNTDQAMILVLRKHAEVMEACHSAFLILIHGIIQPQNAAACVMS